MDPKPPSVPAGLSSAERTAGMLRDWIIRGDLAPGTALREEPLAAQLNVSRNTLREALRQLTAEALVEHKLYKGATVRRIGIDEVQDIFRLRRAIEQKAVEESANALQTQFAAIERTVETAEAALKAQAWQEVGTASLRFHLAIVAMLGSRKLDEFFSTIVAQLRLVFSEVGPDAVFQAPWIARDRHICELICTGRRTEASAAMRVYLEDSENWILDALRSKRRAPARLRRTA
ncbi:MAG: GntR family transcriptional regulator [Lautropia sp.]